jgi:hypothetical protein
VVILSGAESFAGEENLSVDSTPAQVLMPVLPGAESSNGENNTSADSTHAQVLILSGAESSAGEENTSATSKPLVPIFFKNYRQYFVSAFTLCWAGTTDILLDECESGFSLSDKCGSGSRFSVLKFWQHT